jgi:beta-glucanase (GH16 family)
MRIKNMILLSLFWIAFLTANAQRQNINVQGAVVSNGKGVAGVAVTDGVSVVKTDAKGKYILGTGSDRDFIYYTLPSGYESPVVDGVPVFYKAIDKSNRKQKINFEITKSDMPQNAHAFIACADPQVLDFEDFDKLKLVVADMKETADRLKTETPVHAISLGDLVFDRLNYFDDYKKVIAETGVPFYQVIGNHDIDFNNRSDELSAVTYSEKFGPPYYSFKKGKVHYVTLKDVFYYGDSYRYIGYIDETQLQWLEQDLSDLEPGSLVVVSLHIPTTLNLAPGQGSTSLSNSVMNRNALFKILEPFNVHILAGHSHTQWNTLISPGIFEHVHAAASGAWWQGEISTDGSPKGYTVYKVDGDKLSWYFKGVGLKQDNQFKLYPVGSDELYPDCIIANVFNYDPEWQVSWYENGVLMGEMQQYWGKDPLAAEMYQPGKSKRHSWLSSSQTNHLFRASVNDPNAQITVVVKDRFGNEYKESLAPVAEKKNIDGWKLIWSDEFSIAGLPDSTRWNYDTRGNEYGWGNNELQWYTVANPDNAFVSNGILKITARHEPTHGKEYSSARLTTKEKGDWKYGKFEIRAKMPTGRGTWPAIWMLPTVNSYGGWPHSGEIDIMEHVGYDPDTVHSTVHTTKFNHMIGTQVGKPIYVKTATTGFHVYTTEWDENEIRSYVDGQLYFTFKNDGTGHEAWPFDQPFHLILNLAIGGGWGGQKGVDNSLFPHVFEVDYVRVYQKE